MCALLLLPLPPLKVMRTQIQRSSCLSRLFDSPPGEQSVLSQAHSRGSYQRALGILRHTGYKTPSSKTQAALPPALTANSTPPVICHSSSCTRARRGRSLQRSTRGEQQEQQQQGAARRGWRSRVLVFSGSQTLRLEDRGLQDQRKSVSLPKSTQHGVDKQAYMRGCLFQGA